ncbi:triose-phosphate isomerase [Actinotalea sp. K2]|nr:triose-phosphate isomerase [Actinotalea sp. K2]
MTKTLAEARRYARRLADAWGDGTAMPGVQPFVIPSATAIAAVRSELGSSPVLVGAQDAHWEDAGAWTGEVSVPQVADAGAVMVEIGHSERREHFGETDERVNAKVLATLRHGLRPLVCVGETAAVRDEGGADAHVVRQVEAALRGVDDPSGVLVAYEPVWAIGSRGRPAGPEDIVGVVAAIRASAPGVAGVLYGGSVAQGNAAELLAVPGVDGVFVGRAAWSVEGLVEIAYLAGRSRQVPSP